MYKLYTLDNQFIEKAYLVPVNFTGIVSMNNGSKWWYLNGKQHRIDGPAIILHDGSKEYYVHDVKITEQHFNILLNTIKLKELL